MDPLQREELVKAVYSDKDIRDYEVVLKCKDGTPLPVSVSCHLYYDEDQTVLGVEGIFKEISAK
jgi:hypothetical protein